MNTLSPSSPLSLDNSLDGSPDHNHNVPPPAHLAQSRELPVLDGVRLNHHSQSPTAKPKPYADALKFGLGGGCHGHSQVPPPKSKFCSQFPGSNTTGLLSVGQTSHSTDLPNPDPSLPQNPHPSQQEELLNCCLIRKIWGDPLPIPTIIHKTKKDWCFVKGQVDYIDTGNNWILLRFANVEDRVLVYDQRSWHVNGLNFVLQKWSTCFDSYIASITKIGQRVKVPRLPCEF